MRISIFFLESHLCLGTAVIDTALDDYDQPLDYNPQSLTYGGGYRCGYCMSVCPAGLSLIGPYLDHRMEYIERVVKPLQERKENVYVLPDQDSETAVRKKFPNKTPKPA